MSSDISAKNKRIAKNTIALYFRTFITMIVGLYTGRVMLQALGVNDYGVYSVVGGIIGFSSLITATMSHAISRYITYTLGKGDKEKLKIMFSTSINAQIFMSVIAAIALEIVGEWFLNTQANLPEGRLFAAKWVLHCSIITLAISLISSPFNALIISHERMGVYAYTSIADAVLKLAVCFAINVYGGDRLILFAVLHILVALILRGFYGWYCKKNFEEAHYSLRLFNKNLLKEIATFSGWNLMNNSASVLATQGVSMLVNVFFGVVFNASRSIAIHVNSAVQSFVHNFGTAFTPQIIKSCAAGDIAYAVRLVNRSTKFQWLMTYMFIVPVCMESEMILQLWLGKVPTMAPLFVKLAMFESLSVTSGQNLFRLIQANGTIKKYSVHAAMTAGLIFPIVWLTFALGAPVWISYVVYIIDFFLLNLVRFYDIKKLMPFSIRQHINECLKPCIIVSITSFIIPLFVSHFMEQGLIRFFVMITISVMWTGLMCIVFGLNKNERNFVFLKVKQIYNKALHR